MLFRKVLFFGDWKAAFKASEEKAGGPLTMPNIGVKSVMMKATNYSPIQ